jgi:hemoglobin
VHSQDVGEGAVIAGDADERIGQLVSGFYAKVRSDATLGPVFNTAVKDWDVHLDKLRAFWASVVFGTGSYKGNPFAAHIGRGITPQMFDRWLQLWEETALEIFPPSIAETYVTKANRIAESLKLGLFFRPEASRPLA